MSRDRSGNPFSHPADWIAWKIWRRGWCIVTDFTFSDVNQTLGATRVDSRRALSTRFTGGKIRMRIVLDWGRKRKFWTKQKASIVWGEGVIGVSKKMDSFIIILLFKSKGRIIQWYIIRPFLRTAKELRGTRERYDVEKLPRERPWIRIIEQVWRTLITGADYELFSQGAWMCKKMCSTEKTVQQHFSRVPTSYKVITENESFWEKGGSLWVFSLVVFKPCTSRFLR